MSNQITVLERQGQFYVSDGEREYIIPRGAEGDGEPGAPSGGDGEGTAPSGEDGVQPQPEAQPSGEGGQGFIEPYLEGVDESLRPVVQEKLEKFRQDQDAQVTRRFDQLRQETQIPVTVYQSLMNDPAGTLEWIAERFEQDRGVNLRQQMIERWNEQNSGQGEETPPDPNAALTQADIDRILDEREQARAAEQQRQQEQVRMQEQQTQTVYGWMDEAAKSFGLEFQDADGQPDPLRTAIALQANELHNSGQARGKAAVEMVVEAMSKRFGSSNGSNGNKGEEPRTANGGSAPPSQPLDVTDKGQRRDRMMELFTGGQ